MNLFLGFRRISNLYTGAFIVSLALFSSTPQFASAAASAEQEKAPQVVTIDGQEVAVTAQSVLMLVNAKRHGEAVAMLNILVEQGIADAVFSDFVHALILRNEKRFDEAIQLMRNILANLPQLTMVRAALAETLYMNKEFEAARHHYAILAQSNLNPQLSSHFQSYVDRIDSMSPWSASGYISLAPSTNINNGTDTDTIRFWGLDFKVNEDAKRKSGVGVQGGGTVAYTLGVGKPVSLTFAVGGSFKRYKEEKANSYTIRSSLALRLTGNSNNITFGINGNKYYNHEGLSRTQMGFFFNGSIPIRNNFAWNYAGNVTHNIYKEELNYYDGRIIGASVGFRYAPLTYVTVGLTGGAGITTTQIHKNNNRSWNVNFDTRVELPLGITVASSIAYENTLYDDLFSAVKELAMRRLDHTIVFSSTFTKRNWSLLGFAPQLTYTFTNNDSNISTQTYRTHTVNMSITKEF